MGDFVRTIGDGIGGLIGGSIDAVGDAFGTIVGTLQAILPGPLFPAAVIGVAALTAWWLFKK
jgi:hypothetical protein